MNHNFSAHSWSAQASSLTVWNRLLSDRSQVMKRPTLKGGGTKKIIFEIFFWIYKLRTKQTFLSAFYLISQKFNSTSRVDESHMNHGLNLKIDFFISN